MLVTAVALACVNPAVDLVCEQVRKWDPRARGEGAVTSLQMRCNPGGGVGAALLGLAVDPSGLVAYLPAGEALGVRARAPVAVSVAVPCAVCCECFVLCTLCC